MVAATLDEWRIYMIAKGGGFEKLGDGTRRLPYYDSQILLEDSATDSIVGSFSYPKAMQKLKYKSETQATSALIVYP